LFFIYVFVVLLCYYLYGEQKIFKLFFLYPGECLPAVSTDTRSRQACGQHQGSVDTTDIEDGGRDFAVVTWRHPDCGRVDAPRGTQAAD